MHHPRDLFPETLLVTVADGHVFTTSRKVAEHFGKRHDHVLRDINKLIAELADEAFTAPNFGASTYTDSTGRSLPEYHLSHDGFALLAMGFTGREALRWKVAFLAAFRQMETTLHAQATREAQALYQVRPRWKPIAQHPSLSRRELIALTGHRSAASVTACRRRMRDAGLL